MEYSINTNYLEIIAGTSNKYNPVYEAAATNVEKNTNKGIKYLANFLNSIETIAEKSAVKDERISKSNGNIRKFEGYDDIKSALDFLTKNLKDIKGVKDCIEMHDLIVKYQPQYSEAYDLKNKIVVYEYESAVYMLVTNLSMILANNMDVVSNGTEIKIQKKSAETFGVIPKTMEELLKQMKMSEHAVYLDELNKSFAESEAGQVTTEGVYVEMINPVAAVATASSFIGLAGSVIKNVFSSFKGGMNIFKKIRKSMFGIVPIIRSIVYIRYKKKADTILALEQQVAFISNNIEQLEKRTNMDPKQKALIIKKQKAYIEAYNKKAAKLRAQLMECEKEAATEIAKDDKNIGNADDDFVLESGKTIHDVFTEKKSTKTPAQIEKFREEMQEHRFLKIFGKKKKDEKAKEEPKEDAEKVKRLNEIKEATKAVVEAFREENKCPSISLNMKASSDKEDECLDSKFGGNPYWPNDMEWPTAVNPRTNQKIDLICYAQLNFDKLPHIEGYPTTGIMQFFITDEEDYDKDGCCKVFYHKDPSIDKCIPVDQIPVTTSTQEINDNLAIDGCWIVESAKLEDTYPSASYILEHEDILNEIVTKIAEKVGESWKTLKDIEDKEENNAVTDVIWDCAKSNYGCFIGGYPFFTQYDPEFDMTHVLQMDSCEGMQWGDYGVAHFYCTEKALKALKFNDNDCRFYWDCY